MARPRPVLKGWDDSHLRELDEASPMLWVETVLSAGAGAGKLRSWAYGEVREAILRELERRGEFPGTARKVADLRTLRGLKALDRQAALESRGARYRLREEWAESVGIRAAVRNGVRRKFQRWTLTARVPGLSTSPTSVTGVFQTTVGLFGPVAKSRAIRLNLNPAFSRPWWMEAPRPRKGS